MSDSVFTLDLNETFPRLTRPPIVEAVIHWQARAQRPFEQDALQQILATKLPDYPKSAVMRGFGLRATLSEESSNVQHERRGFVGLRLSTEDGRHIAQFSREGLTLSRANPYERWEPFVDAATRAWNVFVEVAGPVDVERLGVRFINHIAAATPMNLRDYLRDPPTCPSNLPLEEFVYQSTFSVPGHPFGVRVIKVMQPSMPELQSSSGLFLDIDVHSMAAIPNEPDLLDAALARMRWLKNKVFFSLLTDAAIGSLNETNK